VKGVLTLWRDAAEPTSTDSAEALGRLLRRDPGALIVAEVDGRIVGSVIAGWDGWRGAIYRLAVGPEHRRRGLGKALLGAAEERLTGLGGRRLHAIVVEANADAVAFWDATDWEHQGGQLRFAKG
jgi:ribosomal protein S18 acetylase RimI-like enzyme